MTEKNGVISRWLLGVVGALIVGCVVGWVTWVYAEVGTLHDVSKANSVHISSLQECTSNIKDSQLRMENKLDKLMEKFMGASYASTIGVAQPIRRPNSISVGNQADDS